MKLSKFSLKVWDWRLTALIFLYTTFPAIYQSYQLYLIGNEMPSLSGLAIASQWQFVQVFFEIIQEASVFPIFFFIGSKIHQNEEIVVRRLKSCFVWLIFLQGIAILLLLWYLPAFVELSGAEESIQELTLEYLGIKIWSAGANSLSLGIWIMIESLNKKKILLGIIFVKTVSMILLDSLFFGGYSFSLNLGIIGAAYSSLIVDCLVFLLGIGLLTHSLRISILTCFKVPGLLDFKLFRNIGAGIGLESFVKNMAYWFLILKMLNELGANELGGYYLSMHVFWSFALVPILVISEAARVQIANHAENKNRVRQLLRIGLTLTAGIVICWSLIWVFKSNWLPIFTKDPEILDFAQSSLSYLFIPYILLGFNLVLDSLFYGLGKTQYLAYQSLLTNGTVYLGAYLLYLSGFWFPTFENILILFGLGILVDSGLTIYYVKKV